MAVGQRALVYILETGLPRRPSYPRRPARRFLLFPIQSNSQAAVIGDLQMRFEQQISALSKCFVICGTAVLLFASGRVVSASGQVAASTQAPAQSAPATQPPAQQSAAAVPGPRASDHRRRSGENGAREQPGDPGGTIQSAGAGDGPRADARELCARGVHELDEEQQQQSSAEFP